MKSKDRNASRIFYELLERYPVLRICKEQLEAAFSILKETYENNHKLLVAGNGGSAADAEHIVGELMKSFLFNRKIPDEDQEKLREMFGETGIKISQSLEGCLPAIPLTSMPALSSAFLNDVDPLMVFAQMVYGYGCSGDVFLGISTSGNSKNILNALMVAKIKNIKTIGLTGKSGGKMCDLCEVTICVPETETFKIQELHEPIYHAICSMLEADLFLEKEACL